MMMGITYDRSRKYCPLSELTVILTFQSESLWNGKCGPGREPEPSKHTPALLPSPAAAHNGTRPFTHPTPHCPSTTPAGRSSQGSIAHRSWASRIGAARDQPWDLLHAKQGPGSYTSPGSCSRHDLEKLCRPSGCSTTELQLQHSGRTLEVGRVANKPYSKIYL